MRCYGGRPCMGTGPPGFRTKRIIAVFGGSPKQPILESAKELGRLVAAHDQILLTGGTRPVLDSVKNAAICGAGSSPWVGVDRKSPVRAENSTESKRGLVISSDLGHARNYLSCLQTFRTRLVGGRPPSELCGLRLL